MGKDHVAASLSVLPVETLPTFDNTSDLTVIGSVLEPSVTTPRSPCLRAR
jgi:hypothetical protein